MTVAGRTVAAVLILSAVVAMFHGCSATLRASGATVFQFFRAVGAGDAPAACRLLSGAALAKIQARTRTASCEAAVARVHAGLTPAQRAELLKAETEVLEYHSAIRWDFSSRREITLDYNPLGMELVVLTDHEGRETIGDWGREVRELS